MYKNKNLILFLILSLIPSLASSSFVLEKEVGWETGDTIIWSIYIGDVDGDGEQEIITGGSHEDGIYDRAELRVWSVTGDTFKLENITTWRNVSTSEIYSVFVSDVDLDGMEEIITGGGFDGAYGQLKVWNKTDGELNLESEEVWKTISNTGVLSVYVADIDNDSANEIITGGWGPYWKAQLRVWNKTNEILYLENTTEWNTTQNSAVESISADDIDNDGSLEIITFGAINNSYSVQLRIWNKSNGILDLENSTEWIVGKTSSLDSVFTADMDNDGTVEIITGNKIHDGTKFSSQLRIWNKTGEYLNVESEAVWGGNTTIAVHSIYAADVDSDGEVEIITGGDRVGEGTPDMAQLRIWNKSGETLNLEGNIEWYTLSHTSIFSVFAADIDDDGTLEIITGGSYYDGSVWNAQLRIWHFDNIPPTINFVSPTPENNSILNVGAITINLSHKELNPHTLILNWNGTNESYSYSGNHTAITKSVEDGTYTFYVWINDTAGNWNRTETRVITIDTPPESITNLQNTTGTTWINWTWDNPPSDFNHTTIYIDSSFTGNVTSECYNLTNLLPNTSHTISTRTVDTAGNINETWINQTTFTLAEIPELTASVVSSSQIDLSWKSDNPDGTFYELFEDSELIYSGTSTFFNHTGLSPSTTYYYKLRAKNGADLYTKNVSVEATTKSAIICGDGRCEGSETCSSCPQDCGRCPSGRKAYCGDGRCEEGEDCSSCPDDCGVCPTPTLTPIPTPPPLPANVSVLIKKDVGSLEAGESKVVSFERSDIWEIQINVRNAVSNVSIEIQQFIKKPNVSDAPGISYRYLNITAENLTEEDLENATIRFRINLSWIAENEVDDERIALRRYNESWIKLPTKKIGEENESLLYESISLGLSIFAITGEMKIEASPLPALTPTFTPAPEVLPSPSTTPAIPQTPAPPFPGFEVIIAFFALLIFMLRKNSQKG